ncbi:hypothetical protein D3C76_651290 [compost metagenome]|nr:hypothetical protein J53TS2_34240 [Paenibacillus sp. J53TS2]
MNKNITPNKLILILTILIIAVLYFVVTMSYAENGYGLLIQQLNNTIIILLLTLILFKLSK